MKYDKKTSSTQQKTLNLSMRATDFTYVIFYKIDLLKERHLVFYFSATTIK